MTAENLDSFRAEVRGWLEANCPATMRTPAISEAEFFWGGHDPEFFSDDARLWFERMRDRGWTAPGWPTEYGGGGLSPEQVRILQEEMKDCGARPPIISFGIWMLGPALLQFGTDAQKREHLPKIARGEIRWCQGYSEPGAGSDLAALQTRCEDMGDHWLVNGQKVWTSYADEADWCFCLVRTDPTRKHDGISFLLIDMRSSGVETRPIKLISGSSPFCETFFTDVRVPKENLVGEVNQGWAVAKCVLQHERSNISGFKLGTDIHLIALAKAEVGLIDGKLADGDLRARMAAYQMTEHAYALTNQRAQEEASQGRAIDHLVSIFKVAGAALRQEEAELKLEAAGNRAFGWEGEGYQPEELALTRNWLRTKGNSIEGGTTEINLNVLSKRVLGLGAA